MTLSSLLFIRVGFKSAFKIENSQSIKICCRWKYLKELEAGSEGNLEGRVPKIFGSIIEISAWLPDVTPLKIKTLFWFLSSGIFVEEKITHCSPTLCHVSFYV